MGLKGVSVVAWTGLRGERDIKGDKGNGKEQTGNCTNKRWGKKIFDF